MYCNTLCVMQVSIYNMFSAKIYNSCMWFSDGQIVKILKNCLTRYIYLLLKGILFMKNGNILHIYSKKTCVYCNTNGRKHLLLQFSWLVV